MSLGRVSSSRVSSSRVSLSRVSLGGVAGWVAVGLLALLLGVAVFGQWFVSDPASAVGSVAVDRAVPARSVWHLHDAPAAEAAPGADAHELSPGAPRAELLRWWVRATHNAVLVAVSVAFSALVLGTALGALSVYSAHGVGVALSRLVEISGALPSLILVGVLRPWDPSGGVIALIGTLGLLRALEVAQLVRTHVVSARLSDFVQASRALGASRRWQFRIHILPALAGPLWVNLAFGASSVVGLEAALSFTGLGLPADIPTWGGGLGQVYRGGSSAAFALAALSIALTSAALYTLGARLAARLQPS